MTLDPSGPPVARAQSCDAVNIGTIPRSSSVVREGRLVVGDCASNISFRLADVYVFTLLRTAAVRIGMQRTSSQGDPELFLLNPDGTQIARDDDGGGGNYAALIGRSLDAGTYRVEAATARAGGTFAYQLSISVAYTHLPPETSDGAGDDNENGGDSTSSGTTPQTQQPANTGTGSSTSAPARSVRGRVIARIHDRTGDDGEDNYQIEFGFLPTWVLPEQAWSNQERLAAAVEEYRHLLPERRRLTKSRIDERVRDNNQNWLRSNPAVLIPFASPKADDEGLMAGDDTGGVEGRIVARYRPGTGGVLRIEFGFVPEWAFETDEDGLQAQISEHWVRPERRSLFRQQLVDSRGIWFRSSEIEISDQPDNGCPVEIINVPTRIDGQQNVEIPLPSAPPVEIGTIRCPFSTGLSPISVEGLPSGLRFETRNAGENLTTIVIVGTPTAAPRPYSTTITVRGPEGDEVTAGTTIHIGPEPKIPLTRWDGYDPDSAKVGGSVRLLPPRVVGDGPSVAEWTYRSTTPNICRVDDENSGSLTLRSEGQCEVVVTLAAELPEWAEASETEIVNVVDGRVCITWDGYDPPTMTVRGKSPTLLRPRATDCDTRRSLMPTFTYAVANPATDVCQVDDNRGTITVDQVGPCSIVVTAAASGNYGSATSRPRSVTITDKIPPPVCQLSYDDDLAVGGRANANLNCPDGGRPTFSTDDTRFCSVDPDNGEVEGIAEGTCTIVAEVAETSTHAATTVRSNPLRVTAGPVSHRPIDDLALRDDQPRVEIDLGRHFRNADSYRASSSNTRVATTSVNRSLLTIRPAGSDGTSTITVTAMNRGGSTPATFTVTRRTEPPEIVRLNCSPSSTEVNQRVTCTATLRGGEPATYSWSGGDLSGRSQTYTPRFSTAGTKTVSLTVSNSGGSDSDSTTVEVPVTRPVVRINCDPSRVKEGESTTCTMTLLSGGEPDTYSWSGGDSTGSSRVYRPRFSTAGTKTVFLTASNDGGDGRDSTTVVVPPINRAPICDDDPHDVNINEDEDEPFPSAGYCFDPDDDELTLTTTSSNSNIAFVDRTPRGGYIFSGFGHGTATITITATDPGGLSDSARVTVNVRGTPPCSGIDSVFTTVNGSRQTIDLDDYCRHPVPRRSLTYSNASSDNTQCARVSLSGSTLTITPGSTVCATDITFTATGSGLNSRTFSDWFEVIVNPGNTRQGGGNGGNGGNGGTQNTRPSVSISCPSTARLGQDVTCTSSVSGGGPYTYSWTGGVTSSSASYTITAPGRPRISLTVSNSAGSGSDSTTIRVETPPIPPSLEDLARCGSDSVRVYFFNQARWTKHHLDMGWNEAVTTWARRGKTWSESIIDRLSQSQCDQWPTGARYTYTNNPWRGG